MQNSAPLIISEIDSQAILTLIRNEQLDAADLLEEELARATIVKSENLPTDVVAMNTVVQFEDVDTKNSSTITLVYPHEASVDEGRISVLAPVGAALIGLRVGQSIKWPLPNGKEKTLKVIAVTPRVPGIPTPAALT